MPDAPPSPELVSVLRDQAFEEIERVSNLIASYARSTGEAAFRGDETTMFVHMKQLRLCCVSLIRTYKENMGGTDGQDVAGNARPSHANREDQRSGDVLA
jgi:hypothetical protein